MESILVGQTQNLNRKMANARVRQTTKACRRNTYKRYISIPDGVVKRARDKPVRRLLFEAVAPA
jgi:hypothetical protein